MVVRIVDAQAGDALVVDHDAGEARVARDLGQIGHIGIHRRPVVERVEFMLHRCDGEVKAQLGGPQAIDRREVAGDGLRAERRRFHHGVGTGGQAQERPVESVECGVHGSQPVVQRRGRDGDQIALMQDEFLARTQVAVKHRTALRAGAGLVTSIVAAAGTG